MSSANWLPNPLVTGLICLICCLSPGQGLGQGLEDISTVAEQPPRRVVSLGLCTDLLLLALADSEQIASLSWLAADPGFSPLHEQAREFPLNHAQAEEVLALSPDLILANPFSAGATVNLLQRLGHPVQRLGYPTTLAENQSQIQRFAAWLGQPERGQAMLDGLQSRIQASLDQLPEASQGQVAVYYAANGYTYGQGTLQDHVLQRLGLRNLASEVGIVGPGQLSLEGLLAARPDYLLVDQPRASDDQLAHALLHHPAIGRLFPPERRIIVPDSLFQCPGPRLAEAFEILARQVAGETEKEARLP